MGLILYFFEILGGTLDVGCIEGDDRKDREELGNLKKMFETGINSCQFQTYRARDTKLVNERGFVK